MQANMVVDNMQKDKILYVQRWDSEQESWQAANDMPEVKTAKSIILNIGQKALLTIRE